MSPDSLLQNIAILTLLVVYAIAVLLTWKPFYYIYV